MAASGTTDFGESVPTAFGESVPTALVSRLRMILDKTFANFTFLSMCKINHQQI